MNVIEMDGSVNLNAEQDESAVAAVRGGDAERYRELVERHERRVYAVAWSRLGDAALAEEATQEAFIRAYRGLWLLGDGGKFAGWVAAIARRAAINLGLRHRRELNKRERWALEHPAVTGEAAGETEPACTPETLRQALAELPDAHRECLVLFYLEGKSGAEAAAALGISEENLRVRLHRARAALRKRLEGKLEDSLAGLRPSRTLVPAVMAGVLASGSVKAATGTGAVAAGMLAKVGLAKWLLPFASFISYVFFLPALGLSWLAVHLELKNFRDQQGFRARLYRQRILGGLLWLVVVMVVMWTVITRLNIANWQTFYLIIASAGAVAVLLQRRQMMINRNPFFVATTAGSGVMFLCFFLAGMGWVPLQWCLGFVIVQGLVAALFQSQRPMRMDYNLFLRAAEGLLSADTDRPHSRRNRTDREMFAFARFLGTRWLASTYRWRDGGLELMLTPANATVWGMSRSLRGWARNSSLHLSPTGEVTARMCARDRIMLEQLHEGRPPAETELEDQVVQATETAWDRWCAGDMPAAERALGQVPDAEVFLKAHGRSLSTRIQRGMMVGSLLFVAVSFLFIAHLTGSFPTFSMGDLHRQNYQKAMQELKVAKNEEKRFDTLGEAAKESFETGKLDDARRYAQELAALAPQYKNSWDYGNAVHDANLVLGRIAVREHDLKAAKKYLIAAGRSPGSPQMDSFGPNMSLAQDLLAAGDRETVLEYLTLCHRFWKKDRGQLDQWIADVNAGRTPNFGANVLY